MDQQTLFNEAVRTISTQPFATANQELEAVLPEERLKELGNSNVIEYLHDSRLRSLIRSIDSANKPEVMLDYMRKNDADFAIFVDKLLAGVGESPYESSL